jgi:hypothetical protein
MERAQPQALSEVGPTHYAVMGLLSLATMVSLGIISILAKHNVLNCAVGPVEHEDLFYQAWQSIDLEAPWYAAVEVMSNFKFK